MLRSRPLITASQRLRHTWTQHLPLSTTTTTTTTTREKNVVYSPLPAAPIPSQDLHNLMFERVEKWRHLDATECVITGRKYTFGEILDKALRWGGIVNSILPPPSPSSPPQLRTVTLFSKNSPDFPIYLLGTLAAGATVTTINCNYTAAEVARQLSSSETGVVVTEAALEATLKKALQKVEKEVRVFVNGESSEGYANVREMLCDPSKPFCELAEAPIEDTAVMLFSSGTTGPPKGVQLSHRSFTSNLSLFTHPKIFPYHPVEEGQQQEVVTGVMPFYHIYGLYVVTLLSMYQGAKVISFPDFDPMLFVKVIREHKVRVVHMVPPILNFLTSSPHVTSADLESVRGAMCAAAPVPPTTAKLFKEKAPHPVVFQEGFGMTETLGTHMTPLDDERLGYCGKVVPNVEAKVINEEGEALGEGEKGELCIRSPSLMTGYHNNKAATEATVDKAGWLHTGDVATHQDGFFSIVDRLKELIKVKGFQVSPSELEDLLLQHPNVTDVAVVGVPDKKAGELPRAYIIKSSSSSSSCGEKDIHDFLKDKVADFKQLKGGIRFVDALPKNQTGKVLRRELKELAAKDSC